MGRATQPDWESCIASSAQHPRLAPSATMTRLRRIGLRLRHALHRHVYAAWEEATNPAVAVGPKANQPPLASRMHPTLSKRIVKREVNPPAARAGRQTAYPLVYQEQTGGCGKWTGTTSKLQALATLTTLCRIALEALSRADGHDVISVAPFVTKCLPVSVCYFSRAKKAPSGHANLSERWADSASAALQDRTILIVNTFRRKIR